MGGSRSRSGRLGRAAGSIAAGMLTVGLVAGGCYMYANLDELQATIQTIQTGQSDDDSRLNAAADSAIAYAQEMGRPPESNGVGPGYRVNHPAPPGSGIPDGHWCVQGPIGYRIDFTASLAAGSTREKEIARWAETFDQWTRASGGRYVFEYRGPAEYRLSDRDTGGYPIDPQLVPHGEIAISYGVPVDTPGSQWRGYRHDELADSLGFAGTGPVNWMPPESGQFDQAMIVLDAVDSEADSTSVPVPYVHEAGHALGLAHFEDPGQLMYPHPPPQARINNGDRAGIRHLAGLPCS